MAAHQKGGFMRADRLTELLREMDEQNRLRRERAARVPQQPFVFHYQGIFVGGKPHMLMVPATGGFVANWADGRPGLVFGRA
jgi:hypothetical protein